MEPKYKRVFQQGESVQPQTRAIANAGEVILRVPGERSLPKQTLAQALCISPFTKVEVVGSTPRKFGNGNLNTMYRILGTYDMAVVSHQKDPFNRDRDVVELHRNEFNYKKSHAEKTKRLSGIYGLPMDLCSALGENEDVYPVFIQLIIGIKHYLDEKTKKALESSTIGIKKRGLYNFLGSDVCRLIGLERMSEFSTQRIANYILLASAK